MCKPFLYARVREMWNGYLKKTLFYEFTVSGWTDFEERMASTEAAGTVLRIWKSLSRRG